MVVWPFVTGRQLASVDPDERPDGGTAGRLGRLVRHPVRRRLLATVGSHPGLSVAELCRQTHVRRGSVEHHLLLLERTGLVRSVHEGREKHLFLRTMHPERRAAIVFLRKRHHEAVAREIVQHPGLNQKALTERLSVSRKVLRGCLDSLVGNRMVREERESRNRRYYPEDGLGDLLSALR